MGRVIRSAMLSMRVSPEIRLASEDVLQRLGLNITEATELFLRRMIVDQRIPFEIVALDDATYQRIVEDWSKEKHAVKRRHRTSKAPRRTA